MLRLFVNIGLVGWKILLFHHFSLFIPFLSYIMDSLGDQIKALEAQWEGPRLDPNLPFVIRVDGHTFSKYTRPFTKPCDDRLVQAIVGAAGDVIEEFNARTAFVESDEVTFVWDAAVTPENKDSNPVHIFAGRRLKLCSLVAGYMSVRFGYHLRQIPDLPPTLRPSPYFDARVFECPDEETARLAVWWRYALDTWRNGVNCLGQTVFNHKKLFRKSPRDVIEMLKGEGIELKDHDEHLFYGTFVKKELYEKKCQDRKTGEDVVVLRGRTVSRPGSFFKDLSPPEQTKLLLQKYWEERK
jgi:tRNA(His) 5'-end guanylyltransferase